MTDTAQPSHAMHPLRRVPLLAGALGCALYLSSLFSLRADAPPATPADEAPLPASPKAYWEQRLGGIAHQVGPVVLALGERAEVQVPAGCAAIGKEGLSAFLQATQNIPNGNEVGVILSREGWVMFFDFEAIGYVKDDEKDSLDADKLLSTLRSGQEASNEARKKQGWDAMRIDGWAAAPHYDEKTRNLKWATRLASERDNYQSPWINHSIRLLGREGVMSVTVVAGLEKFAEVEPAADQLLTGFRYREGHTYAEFKKGDKIAEYGLAALVLGGAGAVAYKTGLLAKLWKPIALGLVALGAFIAKIWRKITGARGDPPAQNG